MSTDPVAAQIIRRRRNLESSSNCLILNLGIAVEFRNLFWRAPKVETFYLLEKYGVATVMLQRIVYSSSKLGLASEKQKNAKAKNSNKQAQLETFSL